MQEEHACWNGKYIGTEEEKINSQGELSDNEEIKRNIFEKHSKK